MENTGWRPVCSGTYRVLNTTTIIVYAGSLYVSSCNIFQTQISKKKNKKKIVRTKQKPNNTNNTTKNNWKKPMKKCHKQWSKSIPSLSISSSKYCGCCTWSCTWTSTRETYWIICRWCWIMCWFIWCPRLRTIWC